MAFFRHRGVRIALGAAVLGLIAGTVGAIAFNLVFLRDLPDFESIADYRPPTVTELFDRKGRLIAEFATERRRVVPLEQIPVLTRMAFVAAEDGGFFEHRGIDYIGILRAALVNLRAGGEVKQGASTITQQMVKSLLLSPERTYRRKIREVILALRIERTFSKDEILYLYLNQIYFGDGAWGIAEAARSYFNKSPSELSISESALLAGLPQRPSSYAPWRNPKAAEARRRYVLSRMNDEGMIDDARYEEELATPPVLERPAERENFEATAYFTELVRRYLYERFGGDRVMRGGLQVQTSLDLDLQIAAVTSLHRGLEAHDHRQGYRGPLRQVDTDDLELTIAELGTTNGLPLETGEDDAATLLASPAEEGATPAGEDGESTGIAIGPGGDEASAEPLAFALNTPYEGVVVSVDAEANTARIALAPDIEGEVAVENVRWAREPDVKTRGAPVGKIAKVFAPGDVATFVRLESEENDDVATSDLEDDAPLPRLGLHQSPVVQGAILSIENKTGDVLALVGGYDFEQSSFDRVTQAHRQPGSSFKPFIYGAAIAKGRTAVSELVDRPIVYTDPVSGWKYKPRNYGRKFYGPISMRRALAKSVNNATVHLFRDIGVDYVIDYARRFGIQSALDRDLSLALGSSTVTLLELTRAYAIYPSGGRRVVPRYIAQVTDRDGEIMLEDIPLGDPPAPVLQPLPDDTSPEAQLEPYPDGEIFPTDRVISEAEAYLMSNLLKAVVTEGTGRGLRRLGGYLAGKTGTTNDQADAWFMGFSPAITTGVWVGHDQVRALGFGETGAGAALPIWRDYMREALRRYPVRDYPVPEGIVEVRIDPATGLLASSSSKGAYFQPFVEGTEPTERASERSSAEDARRRLRSEAF
ncbi:MAG: PBP1A family penicillin-binding protein [Myxococcota bacterium]|nr:PBP1A family penicillin-binding protein [Myxococcota bacterium]